MPGPSANQGLSSTALPCVVQLGVCVPITPCHKNNIRDLFFIRRGLRECMTAGVCELNGVRFYRLLLNFYCLYQARGTPARTVKCSALE